MKITESRQQVYDALDDAGSTMDAIAKRSGKSIDAARDHMLGLERAGMAHRARVAYNVCYWFKDKTKALACIHEHKEKERPAVVPSVHVVKTKTVFEKGAQIIVPPHVQKQECPPFRGLGFREPEAAVVGGFSSLGVGRYLPDEDAMLRRVARKGA